MCSLSLVIVTSQKEWKFSSGTKHPQQTPKRLKLCFPIINLAMCFKINNPLLYIHAKTWVRFILIDKLYKPYVWRVGWNMVFCPRIKVFLCPFHWWDYSLVLTPMLIKTVTKMTYMYFFSPPQWFTSRTFALHCKWKGVQILVATNPSSYAER